MQETNIPEALQHLDVLGLAVPYIAAWKDGSPDFGRSHAGRRIDCMDDRRCGICNKPLGYWYTLIGGQEMAELRIFSEPGLHDECLAYTLAACPFLSGRFGHAQPTHPERFILPRAKNPAVWPICLYRTRGEYNTDDWRKIVVLRPQKAKEINWLG